MDGLKSYIVHTPGEGVVEGLWGPYSIRLEGMDVYLKSEADKVIAEKDKEIAKLKEQVALLQAEFITEPGV